MSSRTVVVLQGALLIAACGGRIETATSQTNDGVAGTSGAGGVPGGGIPGAGGRGAGGGNAGGRTMGGSSNVGGSVVSCNPDSCPGNGTFNGCCVGPNGPCGINVGTVGCREQMCRTDSDCPLTGMPCMKCPNTPPGTCEPMVMRCVGGICMQSADCPPPPPPPPPPACVPENCPPVTPSAKPCCHGPDGPCGADFGSGCTSAMCLSNQDCPPIPVPCMPCPDGSCAPAYTRCNVGQCIAEHAPCLPPPG